MKLTRGFWVHLSFLSFPQPPEGEGDFRRLSLWNLKSSPGRNVRVKLTDTLLLSENGSCVSKFLHTHSAHIFGPVIEWRSPTYFIFILQNSPFKNQDSVNISNIFKLVCHPLFIAISHLYPCAVRSATDNICVEGSFYKTLFIKVPGQGPER